jgi:hypothetical protein
MSDVTENTTAINWECCDGTDRSQITINGIARQPLPAESRDARRRRKLREHILNADPAPPLAGWIFDRLFGFARHGGN